MTTRTALFALLAAWGVGSAGAACAEELAAGATREESGLTDRVWVQADGELPGVMRIFLSDGTLVQDSCWETHRLSPWRMTSATSVAWDEDGVEIAADIVSVTATDLVLNLRLGDDLIEQRFAAAEVPYVCPDMPKSSV